MFRMEDRTSLIAPMTYIAWTLFLTILMANVGSVTCTWFPEKPQRRHVQCENGRNCTAKFPINSGITCHIHEGQECTSKVPPKEPTTPTALEDLRPYLQAVKMDLFDGSEGFHFSFAVSQQSILSGQSKGVKAEFQTLEWRGDEHPNHVYNQARCRYFNFTASTDGGSSWNPPPTNATFNDRVEIPYPCIGFGIDPDDFQLTLTSFPSSQQLMYDVRWTHWRSFSEDSIWKYQLLAVAAVNGTGNVHVVFQPPYTESKVDGIRVSLIQRPRERYHIVIPLGSPSSTLFTGVQSGYYEVKLTPVGGMCRDQRACRTFKSLPVFVEPTGSTDLIDQTNKNFPTRELTFDVALGVISCVVSVAVVITIFLGYKRLKDIKCFQGAARSMIVVSSTTRPLEIELIFSFRKLLEKALPHTHIFSTCLGEDVGSSFRSDFSSGDAVEESSTFIKSANDTNTSSVTPSLKNFAVVMLVEFDQSTALLHLLPDNSSLVSPRQQREIDFYNKLGVCDVKKKHLVKLDVDGFSVKDEIRTELSSLPDIHCAKGPVETLDETNRFCKQFHLSGDWFNANIYDCLYFLNERCSPRSKLVDITSLSKSEEWAKCHHILSRVVEIHRYSSRSDSGAYSTADTRDNWVKGEDEVETVLDDGNSTSPHPLLSQPFHCSSADFQPRGLFCGDDQVSRDVDTWEKDSFSNMSAVCRDLGGQLFGARSNVGPHMHRDPTTKPTTTVSTLGEGENYIPKEFLASIVPPRL